MKVKDKYIFVIANCTWYIYNFRFELFNEFHNRGYKIILISNKDKYYRFVKKFIFRFENLFLIRGSENLLIELITIIQIIFLYLKYKPYVVINFTIKPCIYGSLIARSLSCKKIIKSVHNFLKKLIFVNLIIKISKTMRLPIFKVLKRFKHFLYAS